ncbi:fumarylacetoacetate hydrolase family protein [Ornithinibacillus sp. 4-3]|uniref:Fumarylacetoacetate hydrolase family protein n=1 Tax=Ornithinibacillus sp. 4-3 TaxID=3231488 RepID=A0AB39HVK3_9BACI
MKLVSYKAKANQSSARMGFIVENKVVDLQESYRLAMFAEENLSAIEEIDKELPACPNAFYRIGQPAFDKAKAAYEYSLQVDKSDVISLDREKVTLETPIPEPRKIICIGRNYIEHAAEMESDVPEFPVLFTKYATSLIGPEDAIEKTPQTEKLDYEVELCIVVGKEAREVKKEDAFAYIAGYTIGNDTTARDLQKRTPQWLQGKAIDRTSPIGPWVVSADELSDPANLNVRSYVNGEKRQDSNTNKLIFDVPFLMEFISHLVTLEPGDIIMTGTPDGVGVAMKPPQFLQAGDIVTLEIENIGTLENKVIDRP